ncbi:MAG: hypothetical protein IPL70_10465 [Uliginosibacterium sp.]|nr:hypothetical protein [Uliginosibacterium sp.]
MELARRLFLTLGVAVVVACAWTCPLDSLAAQQVDAGLKRALTSFATARVLNAVISVAQGTEVAIEPAGVGFNLAPGQILDPVNDLVEQFSHLMLVASISFGVQKMLIAIGGHWLVSTLVTASAVAWALLYLRQHAMPTWLPKVLVVAILIRLAIPVITVGTDVLFRHFLEADYKTSQNFLEAGAASASKLSQKITPPPENQGLLDKMKNMMPSLNISARIDGFVKAAEQWPEQIVKLMVNFLLQTLIIPIAMLWCLIAIARNTLRVQAATLPSKRSLIA